MKKDKIALCYPWLHLYGGGEVFCEYTANKLSKKFNIDIYYYSLDKKIHKKLKFKKNINLISVNSKNYILHFFCTKFMLFAQTFLIIDFNKRLISNYKFMFSLGGEFFSKIKTYQYLHICIYSLNIFEYKNFGLSKIYKKIARFLVVLFCRFLLQINNKKFFDTITFSNSKWSLERAKKTYFIKNHKVFYPCFKIPKLLNESFYNYEKRKNNFVILGRVSSDKNIIDGIKFFNKIKKDIINSHLHIIGPIDDEYFLKIQKINNLKSITFHGLVSLKKRDQILKNCKYGLNFFYSEHFGRNILEMQKFGVIAFARNRGGVRELLFDKNQKYENYNDLILKIKKINFNKEVRKKIYIKNSTRLRKEFTSEKFDYDLLKNLN